MYEKFLKYPAALITILFAIGLFLASCSAWVRPSTTMLCTYLGLAFPVLALLNLAVGLYWITRRSWILVIPAATLIVNGHNLQKTIGLHQSAPAEANANATQLKVLSYNVKLFDFYNKDTQLLDYILKQDADVVCLQEFGYYTGNEKRFLMRKQIMDAMSAKYPYHHFSQSDLKLKGTYGMATFTKHKMVLHEDLEIGSRYKSAIYSDIEVDGKEIRIVNLHLESNKLTGNDKMKLQQLLKDSTNSKAQDLNRKLSEAYKIREAQAEIVAKLVQETDKPILLCGDINDAPVSYTYSTIKADKLTDCFTEKGMGYGATFNEGMIKFRIDEIMHSEEFKTTSYKCDKVNYSDHYPLIVTLEMAGK